MRNKLILVFAWMLTCFSTAILAAEEVTFTVDAPKAVVMGQNFQIVYASNSEIRDLRIPEFNFFEILSGPFTSTMSSSSYVNGQFSSTKSYKSTYVLNPTKVGTFKIPAATATIDGSKRSSNVLTIKVLPEDQQSGASSMNASRGGSTSAASQSVTSDQLFVRAIPSKTTVREQEGLTVTYKIYNKLPSIGFQDMKFPDFKGFMAQEVALPQNQQWERENYNGSNYNTAILKQTVLYPQKTGVINIGSGTFDAIVRIRTASRMSSFFDDDIYTDVKRKISSNGLKIQVNPLPAGKPANFCGVTGSLKIQSSITSTKIKANEAVTIRIKISGNGNLKMIPTPEIDFPEDFEVYDPKVDNAFQNTIQGVSGTKTIEYLAIPQFAGSFEIPGVSLSYFDLGSGSYKTLTTESYKLDVAKGEGGQSVSGNFTDKEQLKMLNSDIRYLKTNVRVNKQANLIFEKTWFWLAYLLPLLFFVVFMIINRKQVQANADIARVRNRKANKVAVKRLKQAGAYLHQNNKEAFYDEVLKALWGYTSDKLNIPLSILTKETIESQLTDFKVGDDIRKEYMDILQICEFARYAPGDSAQQMDELYRKTMNVMNKMENTIKK